MYCGQLKEQLMLFHSLLYSTSMLFLFVTLCFLAQFFILCEVNDLIGRCADF